MQRIGLEDYFNKKERAGEILNLPLSFYLIEPLLNLGVELVGGTVLELIGSSTFQNTGHARLSGDVKQVSTCCHSSLSDFLICWQAVETVV